MIVIDKAYTIGTRIKALRQSKKMTQKELADALSIGYGSIIGYENGRREPNSKAMAALEKYFGVTGAYLRGEDDSSAQQILFAPPAHSVTDLVAELVRALTLDTPYAADGEAKTEYLQRLMDELRHVLGKKNGVQNLDVLQRAFYIITRYCDLVDSLELCEVSRLQRLLEDAISEVRRTLEGYAAIDPTAVIAPPCICLRISQQPASAGTGCYLGIEGFDEQSVPQTSVTERADFGVPISGDSMEPQFHDGDIALVSFEPVQAGDIAVVIMDGEGYIKRIGDGELLSLNDAYDPIPMDDSIRISGKVIGSISAADIL